MLSVYSGIFHTTVHGPKSEIWTVETKTKPEIVPLFSNVSYLMFGVIGDDLLKNAKFVGFDE
jgi:hypothetical protein